MGKILQRIPTNNFFEGGVNNPVYSKKTRLIEVRKF